MGSSIGVRTQPATRWLLRQTLPLLLAVLAAVLARGAHAASPPIDTLALVSQPPLEASRPALALHPQTGARHAAYISQGTFYHARESGDAWQSEPLADSVGYISSQTQYGGFDIQVAPDGRVYAIYLPTGRLEIAELAGGGWSYETLAVLSPPRTPVSLAVSPVTSEPTVAWTKRGAPGSPSEIWLARRSGGSWTSLMLDTTSVPTLAVSVAVDLADRPRVAWGRPRGDTNLGQVLMCAIATTPDGPYVASPVDSGLFGDVSLAVDRSDGEPRIAYHAYRPSDFQAVRYASRTAGLDWESVRVRYSSGLKGSSPSLALDAHGDPFVAVTSYTAIAPGGLVGGEPPSLPGCVFIETGAIFLHHRVGGTGQGAFQVFAAIDLPTLLDVSSGPRALVARAPGLVDLVLRAPAVHTGCAPILLASTSLTPFLDVGPRPDGGVALAPIVPNPTRLGGRVRVEFELARAAGVTLELHDLVGRRVAGRALGHLDAGNRSFDWAPAAPRAGVYWLTVRADGVRLGTRPAVFMR